MRRWLSLDILGLSLLGKNGLPVIQGFSRIGPLQLAGGAGMHWQASYSDTCLPVLTQLGLIGEQMFNGSPGLVS